MRTSVLGRAVRTALTAGSGGLTLGAGTALAQMAPVGATAAHVTQLSQIVVVGTHIPRTSIAKAQPIIRIDRREIEATGYTTVGQLLTNLTATGPSLTVRVNNGNTGMELVDLHSLGAQRVLVLVNGQRWVPTLFGAVDLTTIPLAIVDRVEVLLDGASAIYGSEAMAGVINIITTKNFSGAEADAYLGMFDGHGNGGGWDGRTQQESFTVGTVGKHSSVLLSAGYYNQQPIWMGNRTISKEPELGFGVQNGSDGSLGGRFVVLNGPGGQLVNGCQPSFCDVSGPDPYDRSGFHAWTAADRYNFAPANYLLTPQERWHVYSQGYYDLTDNLSFNFMTTYQRRNSSQQLAPNPWFFGIYGGQTQDGKNIGIAKDAPGNPFGVDLVPYYPSSSGFATWCARYGSATCTSQFDVLLYIGRRPVEVGNRVFSQNNQTFYFNGGFNGYLGLGNNEWQWNANYVYGQTLETTLLQGLADTVRIQQALGEGCASESGCVPLNLFGGPGTITPKTGKFVTFEAHAVRQQVMRDYNAGLAGDFFDGWYAGPWAAAAGYEYEELDGFQQPDPLVVQGNTSGNGGTVTSGRENTNAQYLEFDIPFAHDAPFARDLNVDLAQRWSQFKWDGVGNLYDPATGQVTTGPASGRAHSATPRATIKWKPIDSLLLRGTWTQAFRIPSISELFLGESQSYEGAADPCAVPPPLPIPPGCPERHIQSNGQILSIVGGSANLQPEKAIVRSAGFVYSPNFAPGLDFAADYYKLDLANAVAANGAQFYLNDCYINENPESCQHLVVVGPVVTKVIDLNINVGTVKIEGWDVNSHYRLPATSFGQFDLRLTMNFVQKAVFCIRSGNCRDVVGSLNNSSQPMHRYDLAVDWNYGSWAATWRMRVIGPMWGDCTLSPRNGEGPTPGAPPVFGWCTKIFDYYDANGNKTKNPANAVAIADGQFRFGTTVYNDVQASYTVSQWNTTFTFGVNNVLDKQQGAGVVDLNLYDIPGRFYYGRLSVRF